MIKKLSAATLLAGLMLLSPTASAHEYYADGFVIIHPWALQTDKGATTAPVYLRFDEITKADRLISASSASAGRVDIIRESVAEAQQQATVLDGVALSVGSTIDLVPEGMHLLMRDLKTPLSYERSYPLTLVFERAGTIKTTLSVGQH